MAISKPHLHMKSYWSKKLSYNSLSQLIKRWLLQQFPMQVKLHKKHNDDLAQIFLFCKQILTEIYNNGINAGSIIISQIIISQIEKHMLCLSCVFCDVSLHTFEFKGIFKKQLNHDGEGHMCPCFRKNSCQIIEISFLI